MNERGQVKQTAPSRAARNITTARTCPISDRKVQKLINGLFTCCSLGSPLNSSRDTVIGLTRGNTCGCQFPGEIISKFSSRRGERYLFRVARDVNVLAD